jgi:hypothetical protein
VQRIHGDFVPIVVPQAHVVLRHSPVLALEVRGGIRVRVWLGNMLNLWVTPVDDCNKSKGIVAIVHECPPPTYRSEALLRAHSRGAWVGSAMLGMYYLTSNTVGHT